MDPEQALSELRELAKATLADDSADDLPEKATQLAELFDGLDQWLSRGGFMPKEWAPKPVCRCTREARRLGHMAGCPKART